MTAVPRLYKVLRVVRCKTTPLNPTPPNPKPLNPQNPETPKLLNPKTPYSLQKKGLEHFGGAFRQPPDSLAVLHAEAVGDERLLVCLGL